MRDVTGYSFHAPIQSNSPYVQTMSQSIYETRRLKHTHSPIFKYKRHPPKTPLWAVTWNPFQSRTSSMLRLRIRIQYRHSNTVKITASTPLMRQDPSLCCVRYPKLAPSSASTVLCWLLFLTWFESQFPTVFSYLIGIAIYDCIFRLDLTRHFWPYLTHHVWLDLTRRFRLDSTHCFLIDLIQFPPYSIWLTFNTFVFDSSHSIQVTVH